MNGFLFGMNIALGICGVILLISLAIAKAEYGKIPNKWFILPPCLIVASALWLSITWTNWNYQAVQYQQTLIEQGTKFTRMNPYAHNTNIIFKKIRIDDGKDYRYWLIE